MVSAHVLHNHSGGSESAPAQAPTEVVTALQTPCATGREVLAVVYLLEDGVLIGEPVRLMRFGKDVGYLDETNHFTFLRTIEDAIESAKRMLCSPVEYPAQMAA